jgi:transcriptional regulator with XRE-family HTH domain
MDVREGKMGVSLQEMLDRLPEDRRRGVEARTKELVAEEMTLRDLRKAMGKTQVAMAAKLHMKQENVSRVEQRTDMLLSTLAGYVSALGGRLRLVAEFEGRPPVQIADLASVAPEQREAAPSRLRETMADIAGGKRAPARLRRRTPGANADHPARPAPSRTS